MQEKNNDAPPINNHMILALGLLILFTISYGIYTIYAGTLPNQYEWTATAIERNATLSAEHNGDIYAVTATRLVFQATASPGYFATEAANQYIAETATREYWATQGITATPDESEQTAIAYLEGVTQTVEAEIASGCQSKLLDAQRLVIDYRANIHNPQIRDDTIKTSYMLCPDDIQDLPEWIDDDYILIVFFPDDVSQGDWLTALSLAIEKMPDYPLEPDSISSGTVSLLIDNMKRQSFAYDAAITALDSGLRGQELLDALGVELPKSRPADAQP